MSGLIFEIVGGFIMVGEEAVVVRETVEIEGTDSDGGLIVEGLAAVIELHVVGGFTEEEMFKEVAIGSDFDPDAFLFSNVEGIVDILLADEGEEVGVEFAAEDGGGLDDIFDVVGETVKTGNEEGVEIGGERE